MMSRVYAESPEAATCAAGRIFPSELRIIFLRNQNRGSKGNCFRRAPRPESMVKFRKYPPSSNLAFQRLAEGSRRAWAMPDGSDTEA